MEVDSVAASGAAATGSAQRSTMLQPFTLETTPALQVTAGSQGVDVNDHNALEQWCKKPVTNNLQVFNLVRAYHEKVIRPEYYTLVFQLEAGLAAFTTEFSQFGWRQRTDRPRSTSAEYNSSPQAGRTG